MSFQNILVPTDGSEYTNSAIDKALELAKVVGGSITALYVLDQTMISNMPVDVAVRNIHDALEKEGDDAVRYVRERAESMGISVKVLVKEGVPVNVIVDESSNYDVIVMGTLGRTGVSKFLMGSVAEKVVRASRCPVMVVKAKEVSN